MWRIEMASSHDVLFTFSDWLESPEGRAKIVELTEMNEAAPCLLDFITAWVVSDDDIAWIPSYEMFMTGVVLIIDEWVLSAKEAVQVSLWPDPATGDRRKVEHLLPEDQHDRVSANGVAHPVLSPVMFDMARSGKQHRRLYDIHQALQGPMSRER